MVNPPVSDLPGFAEEHLAYEAWMFVTARDRLFVQSQVTDGFERNLLIESCVLHFRNLVDFFFPPLSPQPDDVTAADYVPGWGNPIVPDILKDARGRANKELAHLTLKRKTGAPPDKSWNFAAIGSALGPVIEDFLRRADRSNITIATEIELRKVYPTIKLAPGLVFTSTGPSH